MRGQIRFSAIDAFNDFVIGIDRVCLEKETA